MAIRDKKYGNETNWEIFLTKIAKEYEFMAVKDSELKKVKSHKSWREGGKGGKGERERENHCRRNDRKFMWEEVCDYNKKTWK